MVDQAYVDNKIDEWLRPATTTEDVIPASRDTITSAAQQATGEIASAIVAVAHNHQEGSGRAWLNALLEQHGASSDLTRNDELLARIAACTVARILVNETSSLRGRVGLLVQSAAFLGLTPVVAELPSIADDAVFDAARRARTRDVPWPSTADTIQEILDREPEEAAEGAEDESDPDEALKAVAAAVDQLFEKLDRRVRLIDEEYNALWWGFTKHSSRLEQPWSTVEPTERRLVYAACELAGLVQVLPGPPTMRGLLATALGDAGGATVAIRAVVEALAAATGIELDATSDPLMPFTFCLGKLQELANADPGTWEAVVRGTSPIDPATEVSALAASAQVYRELELRRLA